MRQPPRSIARRMVLVGLVMLVALSGCKAETTVDVAVAANGRGTVTVTARLDADAARRVPDLDRTLLVKDLATTGWRITGPDRFPDGGVEVSAEHGFDRVEQLGAVMDQLTGGKGPFRGFSLRRSHSFAKTTFHLTGTVDLSGGVDGFGDDDLRKLLNGNILGRPVADLEREIGTPLADAAPVRIRVHLPGAGAKEWSAKLGAPATSIEASSARRAPLAWLFAFAAVLAAVGFVVTVGLVARYNRIHRPPTYIHRPWE